MIEDKRTDVLFVGYQAAGTPGRDIQNYGPRCGWVMLDGKRYTINVGGSSSADKCGLIIRAQSTLARGFGVIPYPL